MHLPKFPLRYKGIGTLSSIISGHPVSNELYLYMTKHSRERWRHKQLIKLCPLPTTQRLTIWRKVAQGTSISPGSRKACKSSQPVAGDLDRLHQMPPSNLVPANWCETIHLNHIVLLMKEEYIFIWISLYKAFNLYRAASIILGSPGREGIFSMLSCAGWLESKSHFVQWDVLPGR